MTVDPTARFAHLLSLPDEEVPLDEAALLIAAHAHPDLDVTKQLARLDELAAGCAVRTLDDLLIHLFDHHGFAGNTDAYADPENSFLDAVMDRGLGIPISLAVLLIEVGRRVGVLLEGVGMPYHFLARHVAAPPALVDAFSGRRIDVDGAARLYRAGAGPDAEFDPVTMLRVATSRETVLRMLANLKDLYTRSQDRESLLWVLRLRTLVPGTPLSESAQLAGVLASSGRATEAADLLDELAQRLPEDAADRARRKARMLRATLN